VLAQSLTMPSRYLPHDGTAIGDGFGLAALVSLQSCIVDQNAGTVDCNPTSPESFAFTWTANGFETRDEKTEFTDTFGPFTTHVQGTFLSQSANSAGTFAAHTNDDSASGTATLADTHNTDVTLDITVPPNN
jgi:hypothetical protein